MAAGGRDQRNPGGFEGSFTRESKGVAKDQAQRGAREGQVSSKDFGLTMCFQPDLKR